MTQEQMTALVAGYQADEVLKAALDAATSAEDAVHIAADHGYPITTDDLDGAASDRDLTDAELEGQAGGTFWVPVGTWVACPACSLPAW